MNGKQISFSGLRINWQIPTELTWYPITATYGMGIFFPVEKIKRSVIRGGIKEL